MSSRLHASEEALETLGCTQAQGLTRPRVLVGGLGMGFTLRAVLDVLSSAAVVTVAELVPAVIQWNREPLAALGAGRASQIPNKPNLPLSRAAPRYAGLQSDRDSGMVPAQF